MVVTLYKPGQSLYVGDKDLHKGVIRALDEEFINENTSFEQNETFFISLRFKKALTDRVVKCLIQFFNSVDYSVTENSDNYLRMSKRENI